MAAIPAVAVNAEASTPQGPRWLIFECQNRTLGVPLERVREIVPPRPFTRIPGCGREVCGLIALRGRVVTVFDLGAVLGLRSACERPEHRVLLLEHGGRVVGVAVEEVLSVAVAAVRTDEPLEAEDAIGTAEAGGRRFEALDVTRMLNRLLA